MVICKMISHYRLDKTIAHESCQINDQKKQDNSAYNRDLGYFFKRLGYRTITKRNHPNGGVLSFRIVGRPAPPEGFQGCLAQCDITRCSHAMGTGFMLKSLPQMSMKEPSSKRTFSSKENISHFFFSDSFKLPTDYYSSFKLNGVNP